MTTHGAHGLLTATLLAAIATAQEMATIGRFVDEGGAPVAGAIVTFATSHPVVYDAFRPPTIVTGATDDDGRFRVVLEAGRVYSAWACEGHDADDPARSAVREGVLAGEVVELTVAERSALRTVAIDGFDALGDGPFTLWVRCDARHGPAWRVPIDEHGTAALPPLPAGRRAVRVLDAAGGIVVADLSWLGNKLYPMKSSRAAVRVVDAAGEPVAGARVEALTVDFVGYGRAPFGGVRQVPGRIRAAPTDAEGRTEVSTRGLVDLVAGFDEGRAALVSGRANGGPLQDGEFEESEFQPPPDPLEVSLTLRDAPTLRGRVHKKEGPIAGVGVLAFGEVRCEGKGNALGSSVSKAFSEGARTDEDGRFAIAGVPRPVGTFAIGVELDDDAHPWPVLVRPRREVPAEPIDIDLDRWPVTTFQVVDAAAGPAHGARVVLWSDREADPVVLVVDRASRVTVQLEPGEWAVLAADGENARFEVVDAVAVSSGDTRPPMRTLQLEPMASCRGTFLDGAGEPRAGARFMLVGSSSKAPPPDASREEKWLYEIAFVLNRGLTYGARVDADGSFVLHFVAVDNCRLTGGFDGSQTPIVLRPGAEYTCQPR